MTTCVRVDSSETNLLIFISLVLFYKESFAFNKKFC